MQTSIATAGPSGTLGRPLGSAAGARSVRAKPFENGILSFDGEPEEVLEGRAAMPVAVFVAATVRWLPRVPRL